MMAVQFVTDLDQMLGENYVLRWVYMGRVGNYGQDKGLALRALRAKICPQRILRPPYKTPTYRWPLKFQWGQINSVKP